MVEAIFDACRDVDATNDSNAELARDKAKGHRQDDDGVKPSFRSRISPKRTLMIQVGRLTSGAVDGPRLGDMKMSESLAGLDGETVCRLTMRDGEYYLEAPYDEKPSSSRES